MSEQKPAALRLLDHGAAGNRPAPPTRERKPPAANHPSVTATPPAAPPEAEVEPVGEGSTRPTKPADWVPYTDRTKKHTFIVERATFEAFKAAAARRGMSIAEAIDRAMLAWIKS